MSKLSFATTIIGVTALATMACGVKHKFDSYNGDVNASGGSDGLDEINAAGLIPCESSAWQPVGVSRPDKLYFLRSCKRDYTEPPKPERNLDIMFALDVTGSMGAELDAVRGAIHSLIEIIAAEKWNLRAGSIAFADEILEEHPVSTKLSELLAAMASNQPNWKAEPGFGGDAPEIGLAAIEKSLQNLQLGDPLGAVEEKVLVYVSDAPAKLFSNHGFDIVHTSTVLKGYSSQLSKMQTQPSFRMFYSSTTSRKGLVDDMPTPLTQLENLVSSSGIAGIKLPFPLVTENLEQTFIVPLRQGAFRTEFCKFEKARFVHVSSGGEIVLENDSGSSKAYMQIAIGAWKSGDYKVTIDKGCSISGTRREEIEMHLP